MPTVILPSKPYAPIPYELHQGDVASNLLVGYLNDLGLPEAAWRPTIKLIHKSGASPKNPRESWLNKDPGYAHTLDDVINDLHELIQTRCLDRSSHGSPGTSLDAYEAAYTNKTTIFAACAKNNEGFDLREIENILPGPSKPKLKRSKCLDKGPWVIIVCHELEKFTLEEWAMMKVPLGMAAIILLHNMWEKYNEELCGLTDPERAKGPLFAPNPRHFIQKDNPYFFAKQLEDLIKKVESSGILP
ncbi:Alpha/beta hydrolase fold-1 [Daldinia grandis]|nr:Alpha/beta hydrolase fold-1 [Daldinia grandis]